MAKKEPFTMDLSIFVGLQVMQGTQISMNHILRVSVLLGRIILFHNNLHLSQNNDHYTAELASLENTVGLLCFNLFTGKEAHSSPDVTLEKMRLYIWFFSLVVVCEILLYHPLQPKGQHNLSTPPQELGETNFTRIIGLVRHLLTAFKTTAQLSPKALMNPFLLTPLFLCTRFLIMSWREGNDSSGRDDVEFIIMLVDRIGTRWPVLSKEFRRLIMMDLGKSIEEVKSMHMGIGSYLDAGCQG